jgi:hypothetical protein
MTDDPREILKAAGVECAEVDDWQTAQLWASDMSEEKVFQAKLTILALARLVAKYEGTAESLQTELLQAALDLGFFIPTLAARLAEYEADHA